MTQKIFVCIIVFMSLMHEVPRLDMPIICSRKSKLEKRL